MIDSPHKVGLRQTHHAKFGVAHVLASERGKTISQVDKLIFSVCQNARQHVRFFHMESEYTYSLSHC